MTIRYIRLTLLQDFRLSYGGGGDAGQVQTWNVIQRWKDGQYLIEHQGNRAFITQAEIECGRKFCEATSFTPQMIFRVESLERLSLWQRFKNWF